VFQGAICLMSGGICVIQTLTRHVSRKKRKRSISSVQVSAGLGRSEIYGAHISPVFRSHGDLLTLLY